MTLLDAVPQLPHRITAVHGSGGFRRRLLEFGLLPGTTIFLRGTPRMGLPLRIEVRSTALSLRWEEAQLIEITPCGTANPAVLATSPATEPSSNASSKNH